jgi:putative transposase
VTSITYFSVWIADASYQGTSSDVPKLLRNRIAALAAAMAIPLRHPQIANIAASMRTFFVSSSIPGKRNLLQSHRSAKLFTDVIYHYRSQHKFLLHSFVVMPDHFHILMTLGREISVERAVQFVEGGFAFRAGKELGFRSPVWQRGFSEMRIFDAVGCARVREYIAENPVKLGVAITAAGYEYSSASGQFDLDDVPQGLKPNVIEAIGRHV